jgi:hypothetical protein
MLPGETILSGASPTCDCGTKLPFQVLSSPAGFYIGTQCSECGPWSRESGYYKTREIAETHLKNNTWEPRS